MHQVSLAALYMLMRKVYDHYIDKTTNNDDGDKVTLPYGVWLKHIRIYHECEGRIVKSVPRINVLASQGVPSDDKR